MKRLLLDVDGIIKLYRAGVLPRVVREFSCVVPQAVYDEVVTHGKAHLYHDAIVIDDILTDTVVIKALPGGEPRNPTLGAGELGILSLLPNEQDAIVVSDDRRFLAELPALNIPFLTPADLLVVLARQGTLTRNEAFDALDRLRPHIRLAAYIDAQEDLETMEHES